MTGSSSAGRSRARGFTLIELMIVVAIIGILAAIAYPSYREQVLRSGRTEARTLLLDAASRQERFYSNNNSYAATAAELGYNNLADGDALSENELYSMAITPGDAGAGGRINEYLLTATPRPGGGMADDGGCLTLTLNQQGVRGATGSRTVDDCWGR